MDCRGAGLGPSESDVRPLRIPPPMSDSAYLDIAGATPLSQESKPNIRVV